MEIEQQEVVKEDEYNFLKMMQLTDKNYNKIRKSRAKSSVVKKAS